MDRFPIARSVLNDACFRLNVLMPQFEQALGENQKVRQELGAIRPELNTLLFHSAMCDQAATVSASGRAMAMKTSKSVATFYRKILEMEHLIQEVQLDNILSYAVKCKEDETMREIALLKEAFKEEAKQLEVFESRSVVKDLRKLQIHQEKSQRELGVLEREVTNMERQMQDKMKKATDYLNRKIISILETLKSIDLLEKKSRGPAASQTRPDSKRRKRPSVPSKVPPKGPILQSALDFLSHFMHFKSNDDKGADREDESDESGSEEQEGPSQSISNQRYDAPSPAKQVRFVASPDMACVHIVERFSSLSTNDDSVGAANPEPNSGNGSQKPWQMAGLSEQEEYEHEEYKDVNEEQEVEYKAEETEEEEEEDYKAEEADLELDKDLDNTLVPSNEKQSSGDYEPGMVESRKKASAQARQPPKVEESEMEESNASWGETVESVELEYMDVEGNAKRSQMTEEGQKSANKMKAEVINVVIIPPSAATSKATSISEDQAMPSIPKSSRFKQTAMDVDKEEYQKMEDEEEIEFPMAQPKPTQFKHPASMAVSPPSSDRAESMLNFSTPTCEFNDDFWPSNTAENNANVGQFYNL